jgi:hypothetical protein
MRCDVEVAVEEANRLLPQVRIDTARAKDCGYDRADVDTGMAKDLCHKRDIGMKELAIQLVRVAGKMGRETQLVSAFVDAGTTVQGKQLAHTADSLLGVREKRL